MTADVILSTRELSVSLGGSKILDSFTVDFWAGHVHAVVGPNGAGKSTLASTLMGLSGYAHATGEIVYRGEPLIGKRVDERARAGITLGWQEPARFEGLPVSRFIAAGARDSSEKNPRRVLDQVGLDPRRYLDRAVDRTLSGGERKRIELASILAMEPKLVMMDEPDSGIDVDALNRIFDAIRHLRRSGATVLLITHSQAVLEQAEHAFLICCGRLIEKGSIEKIGRYFGEKCIPCDHPNQPDL
jgi:Fe-S cluster assembly ATP-binding protein